MPTLKHNRNNETPWCIRQMTAADAEAVSQLVLDAFTEFVAADYAADGVAEIHEYVQPDALCDRQGGDYLVLVAVEDGRVIGMAEVQLKGHITLLFVDRAHHGRGVARALVKAVAATSGTPLTVQASRYAVPFYKRLGFTPQGPESTENGRVYIPMVLN